MDAYTSFARVYDAFMDNIPYEEWGRYIRSLLEEYGVREGLVLDLGCGTGSMTEVLAGYGYDMIGVDLSADMLEIAMEKRQQSGHDILYLQQDMRSFELYGTVAAVVCVCDSMNYILEEEDLTEVFRLVNNYLDPGGIFVFDLNTVYKYEELLGDLSIFIREEENLYRKFTETHYQRAYTLAQVKACLEAGGMEFVTTYDAFTKDAPRPDSDRIYVIAREKGKQHV